MEAQPPMGLKGVTGDGGERSYQVPSKVQGEAGYACDGRMKCARGCMGVYEGARLGKGVGKQHLTSCCTATAHP